MAWNKVSDTVGLRTIEEIVADVVTYFRNRGHKRDIAIEQTALALGLSNRRTRSLFYGEPVAFLPAEAGQVFRAFIKHLDAQAEDYARRADAVKAKRRQMELTL